MDVSVLVSHASYINISCECSLFVFYRFIISSKMHPCVRISGICMILCSLPCVPICCRVIVMLLKRNVRLLGYIFIVTNFLIMKIKVFLFVLGDN